MSLKSIDLQIYIYQGTSGSYTNADLKYTIQKGVVGSDTNVVFEIAELVRDYITLTFNNDYLSRCVWVTTVGTAIDDNDVIYTYGSPITNTYLALDGYGFFEDEVNPALSSHALITANTIYLPENVAGKIPIFAEGVGKVSIDNVDTQITDNGNTNQKIQYITIPANSSTIQVYGTDDATILKTVTVNSVCEPKFNPYKITFVNRMGCYQDLWAFKKSVEKLSVTDKTFKKNIISSSSASYPVYEGQKERYGTNAQKSITLNTGFINEDSNATIEELFLAEQAWIRYGSQTLPVIPKTKSLTYKTSVNDRLANYKIDFDFAFNAINNVR